MRMTLLIAALAIPMLGCASAPGKITDKIIVEFTVKPETRPEFIEAIHEILIDTRAFDGCLGVTVWTNESEDNKVWLLEEWATRAHQEAYVNWRSETGNTSHLAPFLAGGPRFLWLEEH